MSIHRRSGMPRRAFLRRSLAFAAAPMIVPGRVLGRDGGVAPSNRIVFGGIGMGNRMRDILPSFLWCPDIHWAAVSDARADRMASGKEAVDTHYGNTDCVPCPDFRDLLGRADIDAVLIATGNHWHAAASMFAAKAGKDIYCEKPISLTIEEGRRLVEMCRRYGTIYQAGTQRRSTASYRFARDMVLQGRIGRIRSVESQVWTGRTVPHSAPEPVPEGFNYDMWLGPVQWRPFVRARVDRWMYFWDTGEGIHTDMGTHYTDLMQWTLGRDDTGPVEFETSDLVWPDPEQHMSETAISGTFRCRYADGIEGVIFQRGAFKDRYIRYIGDEGWIQVDDDTDVVTAEPASILDLRGAGGAGWANAGDHVRNLLDSIRSRRAPLCHPEAAHRAQSIVQAMTVSARINRRLAWDPRTERFDCAEANRMLRREPRTPWTV